MYVKPDPRFETHLFSVMEKTGGTAARKHVRGWVRSAPLSFNI